MKINTKKVIILSFIFFGILIINNVSFGTDYSTVYLTSTYKYSLVEEFVNILNKGRAEQGLEPVVLSDELTELAMQRASETILLFDHHRPDGSGYIDVSGENIGMNVPTAQGMYDGWYSSAGHKACMMYKTAKYCGIGCVKSQRGSLYWVYLCDYGNSFSDGYSLGKVDKVKTATIKALPGYFKTKTCGKDNKGVLDYSNYFADNSNMYAGDIEYNNVFNVHYYDHIYNLYVGDTKKAWATAYTPSTHSVIENCNVPLALIDNNTYNWVSSNTNIATVDNNGNINTKNVGSCTITATNKTNSSDKIEYTINVCYPFKDAEATYIIDSIDEYIPEYNIPEVIVKYKNKTLIKDVDYTIEYDKGYRDGKINEIQVHIKGKGNFFGKLDMKQYYIDKEYYDYLVWLKEYSTNSSGNNTNNNQNNNTPTINPKPSIDNNINYDDDDDEPMIFTKDSLKISEIEDQTYNGKAKKPEFTAKYWRVRKLKLNKDYTVKYSNNKNVGTAKITITGMGEFTGSVTYTFKIVPRKISKTSIKLAYTKTNYTGKNKKPKITIKDGNKTLKLNKDYTIKYSNNKNIGKSTIKITGIGNYKNSIKKYFSIFPKKQSIKCKSTSSKKIKINWNKDKKASGYIIEYSTNKNFKNSKTLKIKKAKTTSKTIKKLKSGKKYYVRVRTYTYSNNIKYYGSWSKIFKIKVK